MADSPALRLTAGQCRELAMALSKHPRPYQPARKAVAARMAAMGLLEPTDGGFRLTPAGLDAAARQGAQRIIERVNEARATAALPGRAAGAGPGAAPANWPFPVSGHAW